MTVLRNQFILTPYFLDEPLPELGLANTGDWRINRPSLPDRIRGRRLAAIHTALAERVAAAARAGKRPVSVAGDCCTAIGMLAGLQRAGVDPLLVWFDAHGDFNTAETSPSGFLGGMPLAMITARGDAEMMAGAGANPLPDGRVVLTDGRDLDPGERKLIASSGILHLPDTSALLDHAFPDRPLWVHLDTDVLDPRDAPAMRYAAPGGPAAAQMKAVLERIRKTGKLAAVSMATWNPAMDADGRSRRVCLELLTELTGERVVVRG